MLDGIFRNPTEIYFGPSCIKELGSKISHEGTCVLLVYGGDSAKQCGAYDDVIFALNDQGISYHELASVKPNPSADKVRDGIDICKKYNVDLVLAVGGGSVIDTAKAIALGFYSQSMDIFQLFDGAELPEKALPIGVVLTLPGSGSESSPDAVLSFPDRGEKRPITSPLLYPQFAFLNPLYTLGVSNELTMTGLWDAISHVLERYFTTQDNVECSSNLCIGLIKSLIDLAEKLLNEPNNYGYRAEAMWACKLAHDGTFGFGRKADWATHRIAHEIGATYDVRHGDALAVVFPSWMRFCFDKKPRLFLQLGVEIFGPGCKSASDFEECINKLVKKLGLPKSLKAFGIKDTSQLEAISRNCVRNQNSGTIGNYIRLNDQDILTVLTTCC